MSATHTGDQSRSTWTLVEELIKRRRRGARREARRGRSSYREEAGQSPAGRRVVGVADVAAAPDLRRPRRGLARLGHRRQRVRRLPQRLRRHGHGPRAPEDRRGRAAIASSSGTHFAQPTEDALIVAEQLAERTGLPYWRFGNSGTEATLDAVRIMRATTGRDLLVKIEGTYHGHHDALMVSVFPSARTPGPRERPNSVPQTAGHDPRRASSRSINVPFNDARRRRARVRRARRRDRRHDRRAGHDELRRRAARRRLPRRG